MKVIGLLSFFDELDSHLERAVASLAGYVDHLVAVDGAYALFPGAAGFSGGHDAIREAAWDAGIGCTIHYRVSPWEGNEVQKRSFLFKLGHVFAEPEKDWLFIIDGDEEIIEAGDWREQLEQTGYDVGSVLHGEPSVRPRRERRFFRAHPQGISVRHAHYYYIDGGERVLWGPGQVDREEIDLLMLHRPLDRTKSRNKARNRYYEERLLSHAEPMQI